MAAREETISDPFRKLLWVIPKSEEKLMEQIKRHDAAGTLQPDNLARMVDYAKMEFCTVHDIQDLTQQLEAVVVPALRKDLFQYVAVLVPEEKGYIFTVTKMLEYLSENVDLKDILHTRMIGILPFHRRIDHFERCTPAMARIVDSLIVETMKVRQKVKFHRMKDIICCSDEPAASPQRAQEIFEFVMEYWDYEKHITGPGQPTMDRCKYCGHPYGWHYSSCANLEEAKKEKESKLQEFNVGKYYCYNCKNNSHDTDEKGCPSVPKPLEAAPANKAWRPPTPPIPPIPENLSLDTPKPEALPAAPPPPVALPKPSFKPKPANNFPGTCYKCREKGHRAAWCPLYKPPKLVEVKLIAEPRLEGASNEKLSLIEPLPPFCVTCKWSHKGPCKWVRVPRNQEN